MVDKEGHFLTQRRCPAMAQITPRLEILSEDRAGGVAGGVVLHLTAPGMPELVVNEPPPSAPTTTVWYVQCMS